MNLYAYKLFGFILYYEFHDTDAEAVAGLTWLGRLFLTIEYVPWSEEIMKDGEDRK